MRLVKLLGAVLALWAMTGGAGLAAGVLDLKTEYSAVSTIGTGDKAQEGRLWRTPVALRHETAAGARPQTVIARLDRKVAWLLVPDQKLAIEMGLDSVGLPVELLNGGGGLKQTVVGEETIAGRKTTKIRVERPATADKGTRFEGLVWTTADGIIMRLTGSGESEGRKGAVNMSFRDVKVARQDPALFELPAGYRRLQLVGVDLETLLAGIEQLRALGQGLSGRGATPPR